MTKPLVSLLRACMALLFVLSLSVRLEASPTTLATLPPPPAQPGGILASDTSGNYWGTTYAGGTYGAGTIYKVNKTTGVITKVAEFDGSSLGGAPSAGMVTDGAGNFWGTTNYSANGVGPGTIFKVSTSTGTITTVAVLSSGSGSQAGLVKDSSGNFWGTSVNGGAYGYGWIFKVDPTSGTVTSVVDFANATTGGNRGANPYCTLVKDGGYFWGTTYGGGTLGYGTVFKVNASSGSISTVLDFANNQSANNRGANPWGELVSDGAGYFWGTTYGGGGLGVGTVFKVNASTGAVTTLQDLGSTYGGLPKAGLVSDGAGNFWGTNSYYGSGGGGTVFKINASTGTFTVVTSFNYFTGGFGPECTLVSDGAGNLWGTNRQGVAGPTRMGTIFKINTSTSALTSINFSNAAPVSPRAALTSDSSGLIWGTSWYGGTNNYGTVFKMDANTRVITTVVNFANATTGSNRGGSPRAGLVSDGAGYFWGSTQAGGASNFGTVFKVNASSGAITTVVDCTTTTGKSPGGALISDGAGNFWGTASGGGAHNVGTVFKVNASSGVVTTVVDFASTTTGNNRGGGPAGGLVSDGAGNFWGTTVSGGASNRGTIFEVNVSTGAITTWVDFANTTTGNNRGAWPEAELVSDGAGNFWGTTSYGGATNNGTVFEVNASTGAITTLVDFTGGSTGNSRGAHPQTGLVSDGKGNLWGTTAQYSVYGGGTLFEINVSSGAITTLSDFSGGAYPCATLSATAAGLFGSTSGAGYGGAGSLFFIGFGPQYGTPSTGGITSSGATVSGSVNPGGITTSVYVQYGTTTSYGSYSSPVALGSGTSSVPFNIALSGLLPGTTYHYRLFFSTTYGGYYSTDQTFTVAGLRGNPIFVPLAAMRNSPVYPYAGLVSDGAGYLWGTTGGGGAYGYGTVFKVNESTGAVTTVVDFTNFSGGDNRGISPQAALVSDGAGNFWGTTTQGGAIGGGTIFKVNASTGAVTTMVDFTGSANSTDPSRGAGSYAGLADDGAGNFWGTTSAGGLYGGGTLFAYNVSTGTMTTVVDFAATYGAPAFPYGGLAIFGGKVWGTTQAGGSNVGGTLFSYDLTYGIFSVVVNFDPSNPTSNERGWEPYATVVSDGLGNIWGTTQYGGAHGWGTVFAFNVATMTNTVYADFTASGNGADPYRGKWPLGPLFSDGSGNIWGTTTGDGVSGWGTVFAVSTLTGSMTTVVDFDGTTSTTDPQRGAVPYGALSMDSSGNIWGTTLAGGVNNGGTLYKVDLTGAIATMADLGSAGPLNPFAGLVSDGSGYLWGTSQAGGGAYNAGTVFKVNPSTKADPTVMASFLNSNSATDNNRGGAPQAALVSDGAGYFWGTTYGGGVNSVGTVFKVNAGTGAVSTVADFTGGTTGDPRGANPDAGLVSDGLGNFWGTTQAGGANGVGTIFKVNASTGVFATVVDFANATTGGNRGATPDAPLVSDGAGNLWGTTNAGGSHGAGTVFKVNVSTSAITTLVDFAATTTGTNRGGSPTTALASDGAGYFWGTTNVGGANGVGTVFKVNVSTGAITTLVDFDSSSTTASNRGAYPEAALTSDGIGNLWGTTTYGGANGYYGTIFEINAGSGAITTFFDFNGSLPGVPGASSFGTLLSTPAALYGTTANGGLGYYPGNGELFYLALGPQFANPTAGSITSSGATVTGNANPEGMAANVYIEYGTTISYGSQTGASALGSGTSWVPLSIGLSGLSPSTTYHCRLVFVNGDGSFYGADKTFTTTP